MIDLNKALTYIDPSSLDYHEWVEIGMGLKDAGESCDVWDSWSQGDSRYRPGDCEKRWSGFKSSGITKGTIIKRAIDAGYKPESDYVEDVALAWDSEIEYDGNAAKTYTGADELIRYLKAVFKPDEHVNYVTDSYQNDDKYIPSRKGPSDRTAQELIESIQKNDGDIGAALGDWDPAAGAWIRINPVDGNGVNNDNITAFRYALIESDEVPTDQQLKWIYDHKLPCAAIVNSGGKSIHAIVHIDAKDKDEYDERVRWLHKICTDLGFPVDRNNKNPARLSRLPGIDRNGRHQGLIDTNVFYKSFEDWKDYIQNGLDDAELPEIEELSAVWDNMPELSPELIYGVLRKGHKMLLSGPSKAGKSYALIELAIAIAEGDKWMNFKCERGRVLYLNLEIDSASFWNRVKNVYQESGTEPEHLDNLDVWNLRGKAAPMRNLAPKIIRRCAHKGYSAIILDPLYKVQDGDENSAGDISKFTNEFDRIVSELGCSLIYCHHHSKGAQGNKRSYDRSSGSGVFARDPDAILDMIELGNETYRDKEGFGDFTAWRLEGTLREFKAFNPVNVFFRFPVHELDDNGYLDEAKPREADGIDKARKSRKTPEENKADRFQTLDNSFDLVVQKDGYATMEDLANMIGIKERALRNYITEYNNEFGNTYMRSNNKILKFKSQ